MFDAIRDWFDRIWCSFRYRSLTTPSRLSYVTIGRFSSTQINDAIERFRLHESWFNVNNSLNLSQEQFRSVLNRYRVELAADLEGAREELRVVDGYYPPVERLKWLLAGNKPIGGYVLLIDGPSALEFSKPLVPQVPEISSTTGIEVLQRLSKLWGFSTVIIIVGDRQHYTHKYERDLTEIVEHLNQPRPDYRFV